MSLIRLWQWPPAWHFDSYCGPCMQGSIPFFGCINLHCRNSTLVSTHFVFDIVSQKCTRKRCHSDVCHLSVFHMNVYIINRTPSQYPKRRLFVRSRKVSKPRDWYFKLPYRFEIWQAHRQHCCRSACQISERSGNFKYKSRGFETLRDLTERRLFGYWDGAQTDSVISNAGNHCALKLLLSF